MNYIHFPTPSSENKFIQPRNKLFKKYLSKNNKLWSPEKEWIQRYCCEVCYQILTKRESINFSQNKTVCGHITCTKCIDNSNTIEQNPTCPVKDCGKFINSYNTDIIEENTYIFNEDSYSIIDNLENTEIHYCGDIECVWDCGELWCGCIDVCRGRCGMGNIF
jgi:hypothetical protein